MEKDEFEGSLFYSVANAEELFPCSLSSKTHPVAVAKEIINNINQGVLYVVLVQHFVNVKCYAGAVISIIR